MNSASANTFLSVRLLIASILLFKDKSGKISIEELQTICEQQKLPVEDDLLDSLISYCDVDGDRQIDYEEFCKFMNWQSAWQDELTYHQQVSEKVGRI